MRFFLISDNHDTLTGMRLSGVEGVLVSDEDAAARAVRSAMADMGVAVVLITEGAVSLCRELVYGFKLSARSPLIVEIPDRHSCGRSEDSIMKYIRDAIGLKI